MKIQPPENVRRYIEDEKCVPLVKIKNTLWYHITATEAAGLSHFISVLDAITPPEWATLTDSEKWELSCAWNDAERILKNSIIRE